MIDPPTAQQRFGVAAGLENRLFVSADDGRIHAYAATFK